MEGSGHPQRYSEGKHEGARRPAIPDPKCVPSKKGTQADPEASGAACVPMPSQTDQNVRSTAFLEVEANIYVKGRPPLIVILLREELGEGGIKRLVEWMALADIQVRVDEQRSC